MDASDAPFFGISLILRRRKKRPEDEASGELARGRADRPGRNVHLYSNPSSPAMMEAQGRDWRHRADGSLVTQDNWSSGGHLHSPSADRETRSAAVSGGPQDERYLAGPASEPKNPYSAAHRLYAAPGYRATTPERPGGSEGDKPEPD